MGLEKCHSRNVAHRDIKPQNILIGQNGLAKLADFGLSEVVAPGQQSSRFFGSRLFEAPEVIDRIRFDPFAADIWSLGVTMFWIASGKSPFETDDPRYFEDAVHLGITVRPGGLDTAFFKLLRQMIEPDPAKRITIHSIARHPLFVTHLLKPTKYNTAITPQLSDWWRRIAIPRQSALSISANGRSSAAMPTLKQTIGCHHGLAH
jgi:serine/threonine protein kinase